jgi:hypothetical protein
VSTRGQLQPDPPDQWGAYHSPWRAVAGAYPEEEGWEVAPNGCKIDPFLHASEILACGGSDCNGLEDLSNLG